MPVLLLVEPRPTRFRQPLNREGITRPLPDDDTDAGRVCGLGDLPGTAELDDWYSPRGG